ncbi:PREDICTED: uncharacterized protein LOC102029861 isoform X2 [Chinchilla lanigera]|uniref:uncharacterized protein LOC102029861 isoform X2 n=1 Tax=Chinchilla lanigera TaxID=34839 RepID=UPI000698F8DA|nr:PREDICTED: uncharacterized protein LOC102029861 isoform X2 [Chinchilla lanigera]
MRMRQPHARRVNTACCRLLTPAWKQARRGRGLPPRREVLRERRARGRVNFTLPRLNRVFLKKNPSFRRLQNTPFRSPHVLLVAQEAARRGREGPRGLDPARPSHRRCPGQKPCAFSTLDGLSALLGRKTVS